MGNMKNVEIEERAIILKKSIEKALKNGFDIAKNWGYNKSYWFDKTEAAKLLWCENRIEKDYVDYKSVIFNHDFAKAFWGEKRVEITTLLTGLVPYRNLMTKWQYHLQQMVLEEEPLKYLEQFL